MPSLILTVSLSRSGKGAYVEALKAQNDNLIVISRDDFRGHTSLISESEVSYSVGVVFRQAFREQKDVIIADTNLTPKIRKFWYDKARSLGLDFKYLIFKSNFDALKTLSSEDLYKLPPHVLNIQYEKFTDFLNEERRDNVEYLVV